MSGGYNIDAETIVKVEALDLYVLVVTYKDTYKCIFDFGELVPKYPLYKEFQENPGSFYDFKFDSYEIGWKNVFFASDNIRESAIPFDDLVQWLWKRKNALISESLNTSTEVIVKAEALDIFILLVTYKDGYQCVFDFSGLVPESSAYKDFQNNPELFYDFKVYSCKISLKDVDFTADYIRKVAIPLSDAIEWIRKRTRECNP